MTLYSKKEHIVVIGGGYAGLPCALKLASLAQNKFRVTLINRESHQELSCELYRTLRSGEAQYLNLLEPAKRAGVAFIESSVNEIDPANKLLSLKGRSDEKIHYDHLILATGKKAWIPPVSGLAELVSDQEALEKRIFLFRNSTQAQSLRLALKRMSWDKNFSHDRDLFVVIMGAGITGLEVAGEIAALRGKNRQARIVMIDSKPELLPDFSPIARKVLKKELRRLHIECVLGSPAVKINDREVHIKNGQVIPWDLMVLCTGSRIQKKLFQPFASSLDLNRGLRVDSHFQIKNFSDHYAIGDVASIVSSREQLSNTKFVEARAQYAVQEAHYLARYLAKKIISGKVDKSGFEATDFGSLVSLGPYSGLARLGPELPGKFAKLLSPFVFGPAIDEMKRATHLKYLAQIQLDSRL